MNLLEMLIDINSHQCLVNQEGGVSSQVCGLSYSLGFVSELAFEF